MALLDYYQIAIIPFIILFSIPLAIFATITSTLAFTVLLIRVLVIYAELAVAVIPYYLLGFTSARSKRPNTSNVALFPTLHSPLNPRRRKRRTSTGSTASTSTTSLTPVSSALNLSTPASLPLPQSIGPQRDFEGVGGWRLNGPDDDDALWTNMNSRLELPADHVRRHRRNLTSGSMPGERVLESRRRGEGARSYSPEMVSQDQGLGQVQSPNMSRARTPPSGLGGVEEYFPTMGTSPKGAKKSSASITTVNSASSGSSKGSLGLSMKNRSREP